MNKQKYTNNISTKKGLKEANKKEKNLQAET